MVMGVLNQAFDVLVLRYGVQKRVYCNVSAGLTGPSPQGTQHPAPGWSAVASRGWRWECSCASCCPIPVREMGGVGSALPSRSGGTPRPLTPARLVALPGYQRGPPGMGTPAPGTLEQGCA